MHLQLNKKLKIANSSSAMEESKNKNIIKNTFWLLKLSYKYMPLITTLRIIGIINNQAGGLIKAFILGVVIDLSIKYVNEGHSSEYLIQILAIFGSYYIVNNLLNACRNYGDNLFSTRMSYEIPERLIHEKLFRLSIGDIENPDLQNKISRYRENKWTFNYMSGQFFNIIGVFIALSLAILPIIGLLPASTVLIIVFSLPGLIVNKVMIDKLWKIDKDNTVNSRRGWNLVFAISDPQSLKEIKLVNAFEFLRKYFDLAVFTYFKNRKKIMGWWALVDILVSTLVGFAIFLGLYQIVLLSASGLITIGTITFYISALISVASTIDMFSTMLADYAGGNIRLSEMLWVLNHPEDNKEYKNKLDTLTTPPKITINNVSFKYPNSKKYVLNNINLEIKPGEKIAIVGENGAGKTTLVKLLSNIYGTTKGEVNIDEINLKDIEPQSWFNNLGVLYQDYNSYGDLSVLDNIAIGRSERSIDLKAVKEAAKKADAINFINEYTNGFDQILSEGYEGGIRPSTGQWQKIAIARFFYRNAPILILDEPTASIDAVAEANIFDRIYEFIENKTVIIISHRFSTVRNADRIIVMDKGQIVEQGTHKELLALNGKYATAYNLQAKGYKDE